MDSKNRNKYGLNDREMNTILEILEKHPEVTNISLCGSRAKGNYKPGSDIDLAIMSELDFNILTKLQIEFEESDLPYRVDLIDFSSLKNNDIIKHIQNVGVQLLIKTNIALK